MLISIGSPNEIMINFLCFITHWNRNQGRLENIPWNVDQRSL